MMSTQIESRSIKNLLLSELLSGYTAEVTSGDKKSIGVAEKLMVTGSEIFVASLPKDSIDKQVAAMVKIHQMGLKPIPHIVARNIKSSVELKEVLQRFAVEAKIDAALILGGDRDDAVGEFNNSLQLIETGLLQKVGIRKIYLGCYPEGHPRISAEILDTARALKIAAAKRAGLEVELISQFCFEAQPIVEFVKKLRREGITAPLRVGVAGPSSRATLVKYALICGVGASLRALRERQNLAKNMLSGETPEKLLSELALAMSDNPDLGISGVHFFTFGSLEKSAEFVNNMQQINDY